MPRYVLSGLARYRQIPTRDRVVLSIATLFLGVLFLSVAALAQGQTPTQRPVFQSPAQTQSTNPRRVLPITLRRQGVYAPEERAALQRSLERHAGVLNAQAAVVKTVAKLVGPTVVHIRADVRNGTQRIEENGSGVIVKLNDRFYVLTNEHVIHNATLDRIHIGLADGRQVSPLRKWGDPGTDIGVMQIAATGLVDVKLGDSDRIEVGDFVLAIGSPFDLRQSVTFGIISAKGRHDLELGDARVELQDFLQTDAAINPGNSGGPLLDLRGRLVGINTAIASNSGGSDGVGFAIPVNMFMYSARQLVEHGKVTRAYMGVSLDKAFGHEVAARIGLPYPTGARVTRITKGAPAELAHIRTGDVILEYNGTPVRDDSHLVNLVSLTDIGKKVPVTIFRDRKTLTVKVEVKDRSRFEQRR